MRALTLAAGLCVTLVTPGMAQTPEADDQVQVDALRCWRDVRSRAVRVGEPFTMTITCGVVETDQATTVPNELALAPETIDLAPFEVIEGQRYEDIRDGVWRFFQYEYTLRVIDETAFGQDIEVPELEISYHIERSLDGRATLPGRELRYRLPAELVRVVSLVPNTTQDIRGPQGTTFGDADTRMFRADVGSLAAAALAVLALGCLVIAALRVRQYWQGDTGPVVEQPVSDAAIVRRALVELSALQRVSQAGGWSHEVTSRALAALRLVGATAVWAPVAQHRIDAGERVRDGQLSVRQGLIRPHTTVVSSSLTPATIGLEIERLHARDVDEQHLARLHDLHTTLSLFTAARYSHHGEPPADQLTRELEQGLNIVRQLRVLTFPPVQRARRLVDSVRRWWRERWER